MEATQTSLVAKGSQVTKQTVRLNWKSINVIKQERSVKELDVESLHTKLGGDVARMGEPEDRKRKGE